MRFKTTKGMPPSRRAAAAAPEIEHGHDHDDGDELPDDAKPHQLVRIRSCEIAAAIEAVETDDEHHRDGGRGDPNQNLSFEHGDRTHSPPGSFHQLPSRGPGKS